MCTFFWLVDKLAIDFNLGFETNKIKWVDDLFQMSALVANEVNLQLLLLYF